MSTATARAGETEVAILARFLDNDNGRLPEEPARYIVDLHVGSRDKARMHDLAARNQDDKLSPAEKEEMIAFAKATTLLSLLKTKARRTFGINPKTETVS